MLQIFLALSILAASDPCSPGTEPPLCLNAPDPDPLPSCLLAPPTCPLDGAEGIVCSDPTPEACDYF